MEDAESRSFWMQLVMITKRLVNINLSDDLAAASQSEKEFPYCIPSFYRFFMNNCKLAAALTEIDSLDGSKLLSKAGCDV